MLRMPHKRKMRMQHKTDIAAWAVHGLYRADGMVAEVTVELFRSRVS
jgi:hypothetical protein